MLIDREGRFKGYGQPIVGENDNHLTTVTIELTLTEEYLDKEWRNIETEKAIVTAWLYLEKLNGDINEMQVGQLKKAYGWDGRDAFWLQETELSQVIVQVDIKAEEWKGKTKLKVSWLHSGDSDPDRKAQKADEKLKREINARIGMKLRALAGSQPKPTTNQSAAPAPTTPASPLPLSPMDEAWEVFKGKCPDDFTEARLQAEWFTVIALMFPDKTPAQLSVEEWKKFEAECGENITPF